MTEPDLKAIVPSSAELAAAFRQASAEALAVISNCPLDRWTQRTAAEGWTIPSAAMHIALSHPLILTWVRRVASNLPVHDTLEDFAAQNRLDAEKYMEAPQSEVVDAMKLYGAAVERFIEDLTDADLLGKARLEFIGAEWTAAQLLDAILIGHIRGHVANISAAIRTDE